MKENIPLIERIIKYTRVSDGCWEWQSSLHHGIRASITVKSKTKFVARIVYEMAFGKIKSGFLICHACDNPKCVRPSHLYAGTPADNVQDMISKSRKFITKGANHAMAKLNNKKIIEIRGLCKKRNANQRKIAKKYGVSFALVSLIKNRKIWKHI